MPDCRSALVHDGSGEALERGEMCSDGYSGVDTASLSISASTPPGTVLKLVFHTSSTSIITCILHLLPHPLPALPSVYVPRMNCPSFAIFPRPGPPNPASTCSRACNHVVPQYCRPYTGLSRSHRQAGSPLTSLLSGDYATYVRTSI